MFCKHYFLIICSSIAVLIGLLFIISEFGGSLLSALFIGERVSVGASSALFWLTGRHAFRTPY